MRFLPVLLLFCNVCLAQQTVIDSLVNELKNSAGDTLKADKLNALSVEYLNAGRFEEGLQVSAQALALSKKLNYSSGSAIAYGNTGFIYHKLGNYDKALENHFASLKLKEQLNDSTGIGNSLNKIGLVYEKLNDYPKALKYHTASLDVKLALGDKKPIAASYNNIGNIYFSQKDYAKALENYKASLAIKIELKDKKGTASSYNNLAAIYHEQKNYPKALENYQASLKLKEAFGDVYGQAVTHNNIGGLYMDQQKVALARQEELKALQLAETIGASEVIMIASRMMSMCDSARGDYKSAYAYFKKHKQYSDTLFNKDKNEKMAQMAELYESEKKERQIVGLELEKKESALQISESANQRNLFIASTAGLVVIAGLLYFLFYQKKKSNTLLTDKNVVIQRSLQERETLLREIHHRVKNNLQIISSLLNLQSKNTEDKAAQGAVIESRNRVKSMSLIHEQLYQEDNLTGVSMPEYIQHLTESLAHSFGLDNEKVQWNLNLKPLVLDVDTAIPIGLILNELVTNALKYAFPENQSGQITVSLTQEVDRLKLVVADSGKGINPEDDNSKSSFGLNLVTSLAKKLRAEVNVINNNGTRIELLISDFKLANLKATA